MTPTLQPNPGHELTITVNGRSYDRYPLRTELVKPGDDFAGIVFAAVKDIVQAGDVVFLSEKAAAISQNRAYPISEISPSWFARFMSRFVSRSSRGIGLASPETFQLAIDECGIPRILLAALASMLTRPLGIRGVFYRVAGEKAVMIDGPVDYAVPPYNKYASKGPIRCDELCAEISAALGDGVDVVIVDVNDYGARVVGRSSPRINKTLITKILKDNPLGQGSQQTPVGIIRQTIS